MRLTFERVRHDSRMTLPAFENRRLLVAEDVAQLAAPNEAAMQKANMGNTVAPMAPTAPAASAYDLPPRCRAGRDISDMQPLAPTIRSHMTPADTATDTPPHIRPTFPITDCVRIRKGSPRRSKSLLIATSVYKQETERTTTLFPKVKFSETNTSIWLALTPDRQNSQNHSDALLQQCQTNIASTRREATGHTAKGMSVLQPINLVFAVCRTPSIDYAVKDELTLVYIADLNDISSHVSKWSRVADITTVCVKGKRVQRQGTVNDTTHAFMPTPHRPTVALGTQNTLITGTLGATQVVNNKDVIRPHSKMSHHKIHLSTVVSNSAQPVHILAQ